MVKLCHFKQFPLFRGATLQTIIGSIFTYAPKLRSRTRYVELPDHDRLSMEVMTPRKWKPSDPTVMMIHGLCGSHLSPYLVRIARKLFRKKIRTVRLNLRGCGSGKGLAKQVYHCGVSDDVFHAVRHIKRRTPNSPLHLVGFSLSANIVLKLGGERGQECLKYLEQIIAVSPPVEPKTSALNLSKPENRIYEKYFIKGLIEDARFRARQFKEHASCPLSDEMSIYDFDRTYVAPKWGFKSVDEYYAKNSSLPHIQNIAVPCHILFAKDDPIIDYRVLNDQNLPQNVEVYLTEHGGHLGFLGFPHTEDGFHWMDSLVVKWVVKAMNKVA